MIVDRPRDTPFWPVTEGRFGAEGQGLSFGVGNVPTIMALCPRERGDLRSDRAPTYGGDEFVGLPIARQARGGMSFVPHIRPRSDRHCEKVGRSGRI